MEAMETSYGLKALKDLTVADKLDLVQYSHSYARVMNKLMDGTLELARNEAMDIPPHKKEEREAAMNTVYAMNKFMKDLRAAIDFLVEEQFQDTKAAAAKKELATQESIAKIIEFNGGQPGLAMPDGSVVR